jgi:hypothetical protein
MRTKASDLVLDIRYLLIASLLLGGCFRPSFTSDNPYERALALEAAQQKKAADLPDLTVKALSDRDWRVAARSSEIALHEDIKPAVDKAAQALLHRRYSDYRLEHFIALVGARGKKRHGLAIKRYLKHRRPAVRMEAVRALAIERLGKAGMEPALTKRLADKVKRISDVALYILSRYLYVGKVVRTRAA